MRSHFWQRSVSDVSNRIPALVVNHAILYIPPVQCYCNMWFLSENWKQARGEKATGLISFAGGFQLGPSTAGKGCWKLERSADVTRNSEHVRLFFGW